ncbi:hypothetical protein L6164_031629 [Bauhinia variegata]|uniref:Uncharacterized protein n=1 Tax=Bauhinia variegata TaxID=167791 RepID=A0ACB9LG15_BAUVA|nr:hypothetical protein L6164_031629 [Bauhinia variegata]
MDKDEVTHILEICDLYPIIGISVLLEKCLLTEYYEYDKWCLGMHDMLQEMGKNIVIRESNNDVGKRSRLWLREDIDHVLTKNKGTEVIHGIVLDSRRPYKTHWDPVAFSKMCNLKFLILKYLDLPHGLYCLSEGLKYLEWENFPLEELPLGLKLDELVELTMHHSNIKQLWNGTKFFRKLKLIDLKDSIDLIRFPSISGVPCLTRLVLEDCVNLVEVDQSVGLHKKLMVLNLTNCVNLKILPRKLEMDSLKELILSGCSKIKKLPEFGDNMELLTELNLKGCKSLVCLPKSIHNLKSLRILNTSGCFKFSMLPEDLEKNKALEELNVSGTAVREVPPSIARLKSLKKLSLGGHREMESNSWNLPLPFRWKLWKHPVSKAMMLPPVSSFPLLQELCLSYCNLSDESLPLDIGCLSSLAKLDLSGNNFSIIPTSCIANLSKLYYLKLDCCPLLQSVPMLPPNVERLYGRNSDSWKPFSDPLDLCDYLSSHIQMKSGNDPFLMIPGNEIPPLFSNQNYFQLNIQSTFIWEVIFGIDFVSRTTSPDACHSLMSIMVDIPDYCISSEWWGIAVCLVLENPFPASSWFSAPLYWMCKTPGAEFPLPSGNIYVGRIEEFADPHLCILLLRGDDRNIQRHLRGNHGQLQLLFYAEANAHEDDEADDPGMLNISKCGCCVLCKEDLEVWGKAMIERKQSNDFEISSSSLYKSRLREIFDENACCDGFEGEYATASTSNAEAKRRRLG